MKRLNCEKIGLAAFVLLFFFFPVFAQRSERAASGGVRPDRQVERKKATPNPSPQPTPSFVTLTNPQPTPTATPAAPQKEECDNDTIEDGTCPGTFIFIYGFGANARPRGGGNSTLKGGFAFVTYLTKRVFFELDNDNFISNKDELNKRTTGVGETTAWLGGDVLLEKPKAPALTVQYGVKIPTASVSKGIGTGKVDHTILGILSKRFGEEKRTYLELDIGNYFAGKTDPAGGFDNLPFAALVAKQYLDEKKKFRLHVEFGGTFKTNSYDGDAYNLTYLETDLGKNVILRTGGKFGLTDNMPKAGLYLGVKVTGYLSHIFK